jgi:type VI secretion system protein ImpK
MHPEVQIRRENATREADAEAHGSGNIALLYQGLFTAIVRIQGGQGLPEAEAFRKRTKAMLQEVERDASTAGYDGQDVRDTHFAMVAFLDSVVLHSKDPARAEWERRTLQEELFGQTDAGVVFFEKLEHFRSRRDSAQLADILEVYLLCLLLGFEGRYSGGLRGELDVIMEKTGRRIDDIRGGSHEISPAGGLPIEGAPEAPVVIQSRSRFVVVTSVVVVFTILWFLVLKLDLVSVSNQLRAKL